MMEHFDFQHIQKSSHDSLTCFKDSRISVSILPANTLTAEYKKKISENLFPTLGMGWRCLMRMCRVSAGSTIDYWKSQACTEEYNRTGDFIKIAGNLHF